MRDSTVYGNYACNNGGSFGIIDAATGNNTYIGSSMIANNSTFLYASNGELNAGMPRLDSCIVANNSFRTGFDPS